MKTKTIKQTATFDANPKVVYELLMDSKKHSAFSGNEAKMSRKPDGKLSTYGGYCNGYNIELVEGEKIVQAWHFAEEGWPDDHFSICTFIFSKVGHKTKIDFTQTGVPEHKVAALTDGWKQYYWEPMKAYLKKTV